MAGSLGAPPSPAILFALPTVYIQSLWVASPTTCLFFLGAPLTDIVIYVNN